MDAEFKVHMDSLHPSLLRLQTMAPIRVDDLRPSEALSGIYLFTEDDVAMYVGRTRNLRKRFRGHCGESSGHNQAAFAFKLARITSGNEKATYAKLGSRKELAKDPAFAEAFRQAKLRISKMELRFVEERQPLRQIMLEVYATFVLRAKYNDFDTH